MRPPGEATPAPTTPDAVLAARIAPGGLMAGLPPPDLPGFVARFRWRADPRDRWTLLRHPSSDGFFHGDCEDFALTALWLAAGRSWLRLWWWVITCRAMIWNLRTEAGEAHAGLWLRGQGWICNIRPWWAERCPHRRRWPYLAPLLAATLLVKGPVP